MRVLMTGVPMVHGAERVLDIVENSGGLVVAMENCTGLKPLLEDVDEAAADPLRALAEKYFHLPCSVMTPNDRRLDSLRQLAADYRAECVVELVWQACLTYDVESHRVRRFVEGELRLPYLHIETDYSPSDSTRIALRVEALLETVLRGGAKAHAWAVQLAEARVLRTIGPVPFAAMNAIAYSSPFVPAEWIAAHGLRPHRLRLARRREGLDSRYLPVCRGADRCGPDANRCLGLGVDHRLRSDALCGRAAGKPRQLARLSPQRAFYVADSGGAQLYLDELRRLGRFMVQMGGETADQLRTWRRARCAVYRSDSACADAKTLAGGSQPPERSTEDPRNPSGHSRRPVDGRR